MRDPSATLADGDLHLLQNLKQSLGTDSPASQPLSDYEHIALAALGRLAPPPPVPRISEHPQFYPQPTTSQQWDQSFQTSSNPYVALPISPYDTTPFSLQSSNNFSHSAPISQPYPSMSSQYAFQSYQPPEPSTSPSMANMSQPIIPTLQMIPSHHAMQSRQDQEGAPHWGATGTVSTQQATTHHHQQQQQQQYSWTGTTSWDPLPPPLPPQPLQPPHSPTTASRPPRGSGHVKRQSRSRGSHR